MPEFPRPVYIPKNYHETRDPTAGQSKEAAAEAFKRWLRTLPDNHTLVYSDGSKLENGDIIA